MKPVDSIAVPGAHGPGRRAVWLTTALLPAALLLVSACARRSDRGEPQPASLAAQGDHLRARLIAEHTALRPGERELLGVVFEIDPGWHIYSPWRSDTGLPLLVQPEAPDGYRFAEPLWPAPHRLVDEAGILDHVYEKQVVVLLPLQVPPDAQPGHSVTLTCRVDWLVCGDGCIPGQGDLRIALPVEKRDSAPMASSESPQIQAALRQVPLPQDQLTPEASLSWDPDAWEVTVPGATSLVFYPDSTCAALLDPIADGLVHASRLRLRLRPGVGDFPISGVLEVVSARGSGFYRIDSARPEHGGGVPPSRT